MNQLAALLRERRKALGLTMTQVVNKSRYGNLKKGLRRLWELETGGSVYHMDLLHQFAEALDIPPNEVGSALEADRDWEARNLQVRIEDRNLLHTLIIRNREALVVYNPWTVVPFATNALFGDRQSETCIGAMALLWERADDLQPRCDCGDRFFILSWIESPAGGQINGFCPGCGTHQEVYGGSGHHCFEMLKSCLGGTEFHMALSEFPHAVRPASGEIIDALSAVGVDVGDVSR